MKKLHFFDSLKFVLATVACVFAIVPAHAADEIKIATTRYNEQQFTQVETDLDAARTVINDLITQMQTNAVNVSKLAVEKQTRPNADCPAGKNCLLVTDPNGAENWYEIVGADAVQSSSNVPDYFSFTTTPLNAGGSVGFSLTPSGTFTVDWGDGSVPQVIEHTNTTYETYSHSYSNAGPKTIKITGRATGYSTGGSGVLSFGNTSQIASIDGCLGAIFPTLGNANGQQPQFSSTFAGSKITSIPAGLFSGITGAANGMFSGTFSSCSNLTGYVPESTFAGLIQNNSPDANGFMGGIFSGATGMATTCPQNMTEVSTPYKSTYWSIGGGNYAVMCRPN